jgi:long-chain fatty acid transport protein
MTTTLRSAVVLAAVAGLSPVGAAQAAGFSIDTQSARATAMGQATAGLVEDASAIYFNPAGLASQAGTSVQLGGSLIAAGLTFTPNGGQTVNAVAPLSPPPHGFVSHRFGELLSVGVGLTTPFGSRAGWPDGWAARTASTGSALAVYEASPTVALRLLEGRVRLGGGLRLLRGTVEIRRDLRFEGGSFGTAQLGGAGNGVGYSAGVQVDALKDVLTLGASFRSGVDLPFEGRAHFGNVPAEFNQQVFDQALTTRVEMPASLRAGVGVRPLDNLRLGADVLWTDWSGFRSLDIRLVESNTTTYQQKSWRDTLALSLGGEYGVTDALQLRAGVSYDPTPAPTDTLTPDLPDANRFKVSAGAGLALSRSLRLDAGYQLVLLQQTQSTVPAATGLQGAYGGSAHVVSVTAGLSL